MAKTSPSALSIGVDQQAFKPYSAATSLPSSQRKSFGISVTITFFLVKAAVPQEPTLSPISTPLTASR